MTGVNQRTKIIQCNSFLDMIFTEISCDKFSGQATVIYKRTDTHV